MRPVLVVAGRSSSAAAGQDNVKGDSFVALDCVVFADKNLYFCSFALSSESPTPFDKQSIRLSV